VGQEQGMSGMSTTIFELLRILEVDLEIEEDAWPVRIELYRDKEDEAHFRARVWLLETFRIQPTFPQNEQGLPQDEVADEDVLVEWSYNLSEDFNSFSAESEEEALQQILGALEEFAAHATGNGHADS
jgi:hypothetical protein